MKQEEKTKRTRERILEAALTEFGTKRYEAASISSICSEIICQRGCFTITSGVRISFIYTACGMYMTGRWNI